MAIQDYIKLYKEKSGDAWKKLQPRQKVIFSVLAVGIVALFVVVALSFGPGQAGMVPLKVPTNNPHAAISRLAMFSIKSELDPNQGGIVVPRELHDRAGFILMTQGLLPGGGKHYDFLKDTSLSTTEHQLRTQEIAGKNDYLGEVISAMDFITQASVQLTPAASPWTYMGPDDSLKAKALVTVELAGPQQFLNDDQVAAIANLVGNSLQTLDPEKVAITDKATGRPYFYTPDWRDNVTAQRMKMSEESSARNKIEAVLMDFKPRAFVTYRLNKRKEKKHETRYPDKENSVIDYEERRGEAKKGESTAGTSNFGSEFGRDGTNDPGKLVTVRDDELDERVMSKSHDKIVTETEKSLPEIDYDISTAVVTLGEEFSDEINNQKDQIISAVANGAGIPVANVTVLTTGKDMSMLGGGGGGIMSDLSGDQIAQIVLFIMALAAGVALLIMLKKSAPRPLTLSDETMVEEEDEDIPEIPGLPPVDQLSENMVREKVIELVRRNPKAAANLMRRWMILGK